MHTHMQSNMRISFWLPWLMWVGPLAFFAYQFVIRVAPGLMMPELMQKFSIDATDYGMFASLYYFGYAGMQIPVALLLDKYGPRKIITLCVLLCSFGTLGLVFTDHWMIALTSRFLIGAGSAAGFLGTSKVISLWFPKEKYTEMIGLTFTFGLLGALYGGKPVAALMSNLGWEAVLTVVGILGLLLALVLVLFIREPKFQHNCSGHDQMSSSVLTDLKSMVSNKPLIFLAIANLLMVGALEGFADVWGVPYLEVARGISKSEAALFTSTIFFGMLFGGPLLAYFSRKLRSERAVTLACGFLITLLFIFMLGNNAGINDTLLYVLLFAVGILCCYQVLVFSMGVKLVLARQSGIAVAFLNCINMLGGSFFHSSIGVLMDYFWAGNYENNVKVYDASMYTYALALIPIAATLGSVLLMGKLSINSDRSQSHA